MNKHDLWKGRGEISAVLLFVGVFGYVIWERLSGPKSR